MHAKFINVSDNLTHLAALAALMLAVPGKCHVRTKFASNCDNRNQINNNNSNNNSHTANHSDRATIRESIESKEPKKEATNQQANLRRGRRQEKSISERHLTIIMPTIKIALRPQYASGNGSGMPQEMESES
ncbi:uncharacterized protein LOC122322442 [Drosophila grimshawi]|uniref:uncharacterized protein LOC122322442 n=1 Tax=Drosophila grimshawi TaxID=7222 RepID=UPI000C870A27|nr:uncharacterized protein LOC122322442 [Drosophila grimshawi]